MRLNQLEYLVALSQYKTFSATAKAMNISQPALSIAIKDLEQELDVLLITRQRNGIKFTQEGLQVLEKAAKILQDVASIKTIKKEGPAELSGHVHVMTNISLANHISTQIFDAITKQHPQISYSVSRGSYDEMIGRLKVDKIMLGIAQYTNLTKNSYLFDLKQSHLAEFPLKVEELVFLVGKNHPCAKLSQVSMAEILQYPYITCNGLDHHTLDSFRQFGYTHECIRVYDHASVFPVLFHSHGMCSRMVSDAWRLKHIYGDEVHILPVSDRAYFSEFACIYRPKDNPSALEQFVLEQFKQFYQHTSPSSTTA